MTRDTCATSQTGSRQHFNIGPIYFFITFFDIYRRSRCYWAYFYWQAATGNEKRNVACGGNMIETNFESLKTSAKLTLGTISKQQFTVA